MSMVSRRRESILPRTTVIIQHNREPRLCGFAVRSEKQNIKRAMVGLPDGIGPIGLAPMNQLECLAVGLRPLVSERNKVSRQAADDIEDGSVAGGLLPKTLCKLPHLAVQGCDWQWRLLQSQAFDNLLKLCRQGATLAAVFALLPG